MPSTARPPRGLRADKRAAILTAARATFASQGFARATIDAIATEAGVSTRTLYKHFDGKDTLFATVLEESARSVADDYEAAVETGLAAATTARERLLVLARSATKEALGHPEHFAMIEQIRGETAHFPPEVLKAWRKAGPDRVRATTVAELRRLDAEGALEIGDLPRAARQLTALTSGQLGGPKALDAGVRLFERGYAPRTAASGID